MEAAATELAGPQERQDRMLRERLKQRSERCRGFPHWIQSLHRWRLYQPELANHFLDVVLEDLDCNAWTATTKCPFWILIGLVNTYSPFPELLLPIARRVLHIASAATSQTIVYKAMAYLKSSCRCIDKDCFTDAVRIWLLMKNCSVGTSKQSQTWPTSSFGQLISFRCLLWRVYWRPESLQETKHELLELLAR